MSREPGAKAQLVSAVVAVASYALAKYLHAVPEEVDLMVPLITYAATQLVGWLWTRQQTTPVDAPQVPTGTFVTVTGITPEGEADPVVEV